MVVELRNLGVRYGGSPAIFEDFSLSMEPGDRIGLAGESGCGKSTLLRAVAGLLPESARQNGRVQVNGRIGYVPQAGLPSLSPFLRAGRQVEVLAGSPQEASRLLSRVGLADARFSAAYPHQLSGGERQRILIAQALALRPQLLIADEPTANLDPESEDLVLDLLSEAADEMGAAVLVASHRERVFRKLGCRVIRMTPAPVAIPNPDSSLAEARRPLVSVRNLSKTFWRRDWLLRPFPVLRALDGVSMSIASGEWVAISGPSGAGKSTLARCLAGREPWDAGSIEWESAATSLPDRVQLVQQDASESLNPRMSIRDAMREAGLPSHADKLEQIGLPAGWWPRGTSLLSEGQRARVAILRSAERLRYGGLLILDESLAGLDAGTRRSILQYLAGLRRDRGMSLLLVTHDAEAAEEAGARVVQLRNGRIAA